MKRKEEKKKRKRKREKREKILVLVRGNTPVRPESMNPSDPPRVPLHTLDMLSIPRAKSDKHVDFGPIVTAHGRRRLGVQHSSALDWRV